MSSASMPRVMAEKVDLLNTTGSDIDNLNIEGQFITYTGNLNGFTVASLVFQFEADSDNEQIFVDNIRFEGGSGS